MSKIGKHIHIFHIAGNVSECQVLKAWTYYNQHALLPCLILRDLVLSVIGLFVQPFTRVDYSFVAGGEKV